MPTAASGPARCCRVHEFAALFRGCWSGATPTRRPIEEAVARSFAFAIVPRGARHGSGRPANSCARSILRRRTRRPRRPRSALQVPLSSDVDGGPIKGTRRQLSLLPRLGGDAAALFFYANISPQLRSLQPACSGCHWVGKSHSASS